MHVDITMDDNCLNCNYIFNYFKRVFFNNQTRLGAISIVLDLSKMNFWNSFQKVGTWSTASCLFVQRFLEIVSIFLQGNKKVIICLIIPFMTSWTIIYFSTDNWLLYVTSLIAGSIIFIFASSLLVERASRRERYQILLEACRGYDPADVEVLKRRFDAVFPPWGVLVDSPEPREFKVTEASRSIDARLDTLEDAVRSLSAELVAFTLNQVPTNRTPAIHAPTNRTPTIHAPTIHEPQTRTVTPSSSWCYYHVRFGKDARKCGSNLCTFSPKIMAQNKTFKKLYTSGKPEKFTYPYSTWIDF